jgi:hypothetical protein
MVHEDLQMKTVKNEIKNIVKNTLKELGSHPNTLAVNLLDNSECLNRLKLHNILDLPTPFN